MKETTLRHHGALLLALTIFGGLGLSLGFASETNDWAARAEICDRQLISKPKKNAVWADLVEARICLRDFCRAAEALQIWRRTVSNVSKSYPLIERLQGDLDYSQGHLEEATGAWQLYVQQAPVDITGWDRLAWVLERQKRLREAKDALSSALKVKADASHYAWRARLSILLRDWDGAAADVQAGNKLDATKEAIQALFPIFERSDKWRPQLNALDAAVQADGAGVEALLDRMELLAGQGFLEGAYEDAAEAARRSPRSLRAQVWKGALAWERGGIRSEVGDVAKTDRRKLKRWVPHWPTLLRQMDQDNNPETRAQALLKLRQPLLALKEVGETDGSPAKVLALLELKEIPKAGETARRATELHPEAADAWEAMARVNMVNGNPREALQNLDQCMQLNPAGKYTGLRKEAETALGAK